MKLKLSSVLISSLCLLNIGYAANTSTQTNTSINNTFAACIPITKTQKIPTEIYWYNQSAEKKALYREIYSMADQYIQTWVNQTHPKPKTWGIILDIDETVLDNSWFSVQCQNSVSSEDNFEHYVSIPGKSTALPGAAHLVKLVHDLGGYVSFISNRSGTYSDKTGNTLTATINDLKSQGIYFDQVILTNYQDAKDPSDKNSRFNAVITDHYDKTKMVWSNTLPAHKVIAYFGDNIQDFPKLKQKAVQALNGDSPEFNKFGQGYFVFPNPMYGSWE